MIRNSAVRAAFIAVVFVVSLLAAFNTGDILGTVTDSTGALVPRAKVTVVSKETGETRTVTTDDHGRFAVNQLKIGVYTIKAEATSFRAAAAEALVRSGETNTVTFRMELGQVTEVVTVSEAVSTLDASNAQVQTSVADTQIAELPVNRNPLVLAATAPGVVPVQANSGFLSTGNFNTNGGRGRGNNITIDNITATDINTSGQAGLGSLNYAAIKEFKLITNNFNAEFGRNASSQLQLITKSGTNEFHGEAYEFLVNDKLNARDFFDTTGKPAVARFNQFGYVIGGPIRRNKTHFFQTYEGVQLRGAGSARVANVPTPAMVAEVRDATARALLDQYKIPASPTGQVQQSGGNAQKAFQVSGRLDHQFSDTDTLTVRYGHFQQESVASSLTFGATNLANFGATSVDGPRNLGLAETHLFSANLVNEFRFGFGRSSPNFAINSTVPIGPRVIFQNAQVDNFGAWEGLPQGRVQNTFQYSDTVSWNRGAHNLKFGADVYRYQANSILDSAVRPVFQFTDWSSFANGAPAVYQQRFGGTVRGHRITNHFYFVQDDWKVTRNLTLNLGLRTEVAGGVSEVNNLISNLDISCRESVGAGGAGPFGCFTLGKPSNETNVNSSPRVGFAWNPRGNSKTVIRGGYGIAYDFIFLNPITNQRFLPPFIVTQSLAGAPNFTGANSFANILAGTARIQEEGRAALGRFNPAQLNFGNVNPAIDRNLRNPQVHHWNLGVQRELMHDLVLKASYIGAKGNYLLRTQALNLIADPRISPAAASLADEDARLTAFQAANAARNGSAASFSNRIDRRFNDINYVTSSANSNYHAFEFLAHKTFGRGYYFQAAYTAAKSIDDSSDALSVLFNDVMLAQNPRNLRADRSVSQFDIPQRLALTHVWEPQWLRGLSSPWMRRIAHGWGFSGISSFQGGFPVTFDVGARRGVNPLTLTGSTNGPVRPNAAGPVNFQPAPAGSAGARMGLNTDSRQRISAYAESLGLSQPLIGNFGNLARNAVRINGLRNFDWNAYKNTPITERIKLQIRAEFYNIFNNTSFAGVQRVISSPFFGQYASTETTARFMQMGARVIF